MKRDYHMSDCATNNAPALPVGECNCGLEKHLTEEPNTREDNPVKAEYFKIFELPTHQVLITKDFDSEEADSETIVISFFLDGVKITQTLGYASESKRDEMFNNITEEMLQGILDASIDVFS